MYMTASETADEPGWLKTAQKTDPENRLLWKMNRHRLEAESLRDAMLVAAGTLLVRAQQVQAGFSTRIVWLNGAPAGRIEVGGQSIAVSLVVENGQVSRIYAVANPRKLTRLDQPAELAR